MTDSSGFLLRDYQEHAVSEVESYFKEHDKASIVLSNGTGKTRVLVELVKRLSSNHTTLVIVDTAEIAFQISHMFKNEMGDSFAEVLSGVSATKNYTPLKIVTFQRLDKIIELDLEYSLVVVFGMGIPDKLKARLESSFLSRGKQLFLSSVRNRQVDEFAGEPIFEYSHVDAISQGVLRSVEYNVCPQLDMRRHSDVERIPALLKELIGKLSNNSTLKALVICRNISEAERIYKAFQVAESIRPILLHSQLPSVHELLHKFKSDGTYSIAIVVDLYIGLDLPDLTDLVLLRNFSSERALLQAISCVTRVSPNSNHGYVWDFSGNQRLFNQEMGVLVNKEIGVEESAEKNSDVDSEKSTAKTGDLVTPLEDKPAKVDLLGRKGLVDILKGLIERDTKDHLIIALFGHWGSGKSSIIQMLRDKYEPNPSRDFIEFNAWQAEHSNSMAASIAQQLVNDLYEKESVMGQILLSYKARLLQSKSTLIIEFAFVAVITAFFLGLALPEWIKDFKLNFGTLAALSISLPALFSLTVSYCKHPFTGQLKELAKRPNFKEHIGLGHAIREQIFCLLSVHPLSFWQAVKKACGKVVQKEHKYILAIDDLDRCSDKKIIETLEAIQLIVDLPCVNILLAVAPDILLDAVASRYMGQRHGLSDEGSKQLARDFLGKVLQITITLDKPTSINRNQFINTKLYSNLGVKTKAAPVYQPKIDLPRSDYASPQELLDFTDFVDEADGDYDRTESYLKSSADEYDFFVQCSEYFDIHNPRTLIRIHNAITLLKGVYPNIYQSEGVLNYYVYLTFWHEVYAIVDSVKKKAMLNIILPESADLNSNENAENRQLISFENIDHSEIKTMLFRVKNMSLPAIELG